MPPCLDVYVLSGRRDLAMIERFADEFSSSDLHASAGLALPVLPDDCDSDEGLRGEEDWNMVEVPTLAAAIGYGLADPQRAFRLYLAPVAPWRRAMLAFTRSKEIAFGVSVDDPLGEPGPLEQARELMARLADLTDAHRSWIGWEELPPLTPDRDEPWLTSLA